MMSHSRDCQRLTPQQCESCHYRQNFLDTPICLARVNCIFDVPHGPGLAFSQAIFRMPTFLAGPALGRGGTILDEGAQSKPAFAFLGFLCHLGLPFLICRLRGHGARLWTGKVRHPVIRDICYPEGIVLSWSEAPQHPFCFSLYLHQKMIGVLRSNGSHSK
jgi:hypothetical protein